MFSIIIPVYNGEETISENIQKVYVLFKSLKYLFEIIVVDDGSTDDTYLRLKEITLPIKIYQKPVNQGKGAALKTGYKLISKDTDYIIFMDADLQVEPSDITCFIKQMAHFNADGVVGNKHHIYSNTTYSLRRKVLSDCYSLFCRILFGVSLRDTQCGFKLFKRKVIDLVFQRVLGKRFAFDLELIVALRENKIRIIDSPVYVYGLQKSTVKPNTIMDIFIDTCAVWYRQKKGWYKV
jgi:glycosyltransferase involved in cell wall biosynthesis